MNMTNTLTIGVLPGSNLEHIEERLGQYGDFESTSKVTYRLESAEPVSGAVKKKIKNIHGVNYVK